MSTAAQNVDLSTGKVGLSLDLVSVSGPNGFGDSLSLQYSTLGLLEKVKTWNETSYTDLTGLGWQFTQSAIYRLGNGSIKDTFILDDSPLIPLTQTEQLDGSYVLTFTTSSQSLAKITYTTASETWTIVDTNGTTTLYGGVQVHNHIDANAIEWGVRWNAQGAHSPTIWVGNSVETSNQECFAVIWHLKSKTNLYGQTISYGYQKVEGPIGASQFPGQAGKNYTMACYLTSVMVENGGSLVLKYGQKESWEYPELRLQYNQDGSITNAYQDRIPTQYLKQILVYNANGTLGKALNLNYQFLYDYLSLSYPNSNNNLTSDINKLNKRLLVGIETLSPEGLPLAPAQTFDYWGLNGDGYQTVFQNYINSLNTGNNTGFYPHPLLVLTSSQLTGGTPMVDPNNPAVSYYPIFGYIKSSQSASGAVTYYSYRNAADLYNAVTAGTSMPGWSDNWKNQLDSAVIAYPDGKTNKDDSDWEKPQAYWGDNFVVIRWNNSHDKTQICIDVYEWTSGSWVKVQIAGFSSSPYIITVSDNTDSDSVQIATGNGFFGIACCNLSGSANDNGIFYVFNKNIYLPGIWNKKNYIPHTLSTNLELKTTQQVMMLLDKDNGYFYVYGLIGNSWSEKERQSVTHASHSTISAIGNAIFLLGCNKSEMKYLLFQFDPMQSDPWASVSSSWRSLNFSGFAPVPGYGDGYPTDVNSANIGGFIFVNALVRYDLNNWPHTPFVSYEPVLVSWSPDLVDVYNQPVYNDASNLSTPEWQFGAFELNKVNALWSFSNGKINYTQGENPDGSNKLVLSFQGGNHADSLGHNPGFKFAEFDNLWIDEDSLPNTILGNLTIATNNILHYTYTFYQFDPITKQWQPIDNVSQALGSNTNWSALVQIISLELQLMLLLIPGLDLLAPVADGAALAVMEAIKACVKKIPRFIKIGLRVGVGIVQAYAVHELLKSLYGGRRNSLADGKQFLLVGSNQNQPELFYRHTYTEGPQNDPTYQWVDLGSLQNAIKTLSTVVPQGGKSESDAPFALTANVLNLGNDYLCFSYRSEDQNVQQYILRTDQIVYLQNGQMLDISALPMGTYPKDQSSFGHSYGNLTGNVSQIALSILPSQSQTFAQTTDWGAILAYMPSITGHVEVDQSFFDGLNYANLYMLQDGAIQGPIQDYVVDKLGVNNGYQSSHSFFLYSPSEAYVQNSMRAILYNQVRVASGGSSYQDSAQRFGWSENYFYTPKPFFNPALAGHTLPCDPASEASSSLFSQNQSQTNVGTYLNFLLGQAYCTRQLKSKGNGDFTVGYEVQRQLTYYKVFSQLPTDLSSGNSIGSTPAYGALPTLNLSLTAAQNTREEQVTTAYNNRAAALNLGYQLYDLPDFYGSFTPNSYSQWQLYMPVNNQNVVFNSAYPYASFNLSFELNQDLSQTTLTGSYTQNFPSWYVANYDVSDYSRFIDLNLLQTLQTYTWYHPNLHLSQGNDSHGNPIITLSQLWQTGWQIVSSQVQTWQNAQTPQGETLWSSGTSFQWKGRSDGQAQTTNMQFPWSSPPASGSVTNAQIWQAGARPTLVEQGIPLAVTGPTASPEASLYDRQLLAAIFNVSNAGLSQSPALYLGFETYENSGTSFYNNNQAADLNSVTTTEYSDTGNRSLLCWNTVTYAWTKPFDTAQVTDGLWLVTVRYRTTGTASQSASLAVCAGNPQASPGQATSLTTLYLEPSDGHWVTAKQTFNLGQTLASAQFSGSLELVLRLTTPSGYADKLYLDNLMLAPVQAASFSLTTYDSAALVPIAQASPADTTFADRAVYNRLRRPVASVRTQEDSTQAERISLTAQAFSRMTLAPALAGQALWFDGSLTSQGLITSHGQALCFAYNQDFTIEGWVCYKGPGASGLANVNHQILYTSSGSYQIKIQYSGSAPTLRVQRWDNSGNNPNIFAFDMSDQLFHHVAFVRLSGQLYLYADGNLVGQTADTTTSSMGSSSTLYLGTHANDTFYGAISEFRMWNHGLSQTQIQQNMHKRLTGKEYGLVGYWPCAGSYQDLTANQQTITGSDTSFGNLPVVQEAVTDALNVNVNGHSYTLINDPKNVLEFDAGQNFTVELWVKINSYTSSSTGNMNWILQKLNDPAANYSYAIRLNSSGKVNAARYNSQQSSNNNPGITSLNPINDGKFHHVAFVRYLGNLWLYVDGNSQGAVVDTLSKSFSNTSPVNISRSGADWFDGEVMELRIWNYGRSQQQVREAMYTRLSGQEYGLNGYWPLNGDYTDHSVNRQNMSPATASACGFVPATQTIVTPNESFVPLNPNSSLMIQASGQYDPSTRLTQAGALFDFRAGQNTWAGGSLLGRMLVVNPNQTATYPLPAGFDGIGIRVQLQGYEDIFECVFQGSPQGQACYLNAGDYQWAGLETNRAIYNNNTLFIYGMTPDGAFLENGNTNLGTSYQVVTGSSQSYVSDALGRVYYTLQQNNQYTVGSCSAERQPSPNLIAATTMQLYPPLAAVNGWLYLADLDNGLYCVNIQNVSQLSQGENLKRLISYSQLAANSNCIAPPVLSPDRRQLVWMLSAGSDSILVSYDLERNVAHFKTITGKTFTGQPSIAADGTIYYLTQNETLYAFASNLQILTYVALPTVPVGSPVVGAGVVCVNLSSGKLVIYDQNLELVASIQVADSLTGSPVICGNQILVTATAGASQNIYTYNPAGVPVMPPLPVTGNTWMIPAVNAQEEQAGFLAQTGNRLTHWVVGTPSASLSLGSYTVSWDAVKRRFSLSGVSPSIPSVPVRFTAGDWLLMISGGTLYFYADGQQIFAVPGVNPPSSGNYTLKAQGQALGARDILLFNNPTLSLSYADGLGQTRQTQSLATVMPPTQA